MYCVGNSRAKSGILGQFWCKRVSQIFGMSHAFAPLYECRGPNGKRTDPQVVFHVPGVPLISLTSTFIISSRSTSNLTNTTNYRTHKHPITQPNPTQPQNESLNHNPPPPPPNPNHNRTPHVPQRRTPLSAEPPAPHRRLPHPRRGLVRPRDTDPLHPTSGVLAVLRLGRGIHPGWV